MSVALPFLPLFHKVLFPFVSLLFKYLEAQLKENSDPVVLATTHSLEKSVIVISTQ